MDPLVPKVVKLVDTHILYPLFKSTIITCRLSESLQRLSSLCLRPQSNFKDFVFHQKILNLEYGRAGHYHC